MILKNYLFVFMVKNIGLQGRRGQKVHPLPILKPRIKYYQDENGNIRLITPGLIVVGIHATFVYGIVIGSLLRPIFDEHI